MAQFQVYTCPDASEGQRCLVITISRGERMPVVYYGANPEAALDVAKAGWEKMMADAAKKAVPRAPKKAKAESEVEEIEEAI